MEKPIIATSLVGVILSSEPWERAHIKWFEDASIRLGDGNILEWIKLKDYFPKVDYIMEQEYPDLSPKERNVLAREIYFSYVLKYVRENDVVKQDVLEYLQFLKKDYRIALISTQTSDVLDEVLIRAGLDGFFDVVVCSREDEKDDKPAVYSRFTSKYGDPVLYFESGTSLDDMKKKVEKL